MRRPTSTPIWGKQLDAQMQWRSFFALWCTTFRPVLSYVWSGRAANSRAMTQQVIERLLVLGSVALAAFLISWQMIMFLRPWLARFALARPNSRSSHRVATPQGGGLAVVAATLAVAWLAIALAPGIAHAEGCQFLALTAAAALLATVGAIDDIRSLPAALRLLLQCIAVGGVLAAVPRSRSFCRRCPGGSSAPVCFWAVCGWSIS